MKTLSGEKDRYSFELGAAIGSIVGGFIGGKAYKMYDAHKIGKIAQRGLLL